MERGRSQFSAARKLAFGWGAPVLAAAFCITLTGCAGGSVVQALASMDSPEIEQFSAPPGMPARRGEPGGSSPDSWGRESLRTIKSDHPRLEMAALVASQGPELLAAQLTPFLDSELKGSDIDLVDGSGRGVILRAKAPARILSLTIDLKNGRSQVAAFGEEGKASVHMRSAIKPGDSGRVKVKLLQPSFSSASVVFVSPGRTDSGTRFRLIKLGEKEGRTKLLYGGSLDSDDFPKAMQVQTGYGRKLPIKVEKASSHGVIFSIATTDLKRAWIVVLPKLKAATLELPLAPGRLQRIQATSRRNSASPLVRVVHEDPNKVAG